MSQVTIRPVETKKDMHDFVELHYRLYKGNPYNVPDLKSDTYDTFNPKKNSGLAFCETKLFLAEKDGRVVGRIAAIINHCANEKWNTKNARFGWIEFEEDIEIARLLLSTVEEWGKEHGMDHLQGPMGITDIDPEGMLIEGFDRLGTMSAIYNFSYYPKFLEELGYEKEIDWIENFMITPDKLPEKFVRVANICRERYGLHERRFKSTREIIKGGYAQKLFELINLSYKDLFGTTSFTQQQIDDYVKRWVPLLDARMISCVFDGEEMVGVGVSMPSIAHALQKAQGKLFPFGWWHLIKALKFKHEDGIEMLLIGVHPDYRAKGVAGIIYDHLFEVYKSMNFKWAETNYMLENNYKSLSQWQSLNPEVHKRRRCYTKEL